MEQLQTEDLIDFYLPRDRKILPLNKIKEAIILYTDDKDYQSQSLIALSKLKNHGITDEQIISFGNLMQVNQSVTSEEKQAISIGFKI